MSSSRTYLGAGLIAIAAILFWVLLMPGYDQISGLRGAIEERGTILEDRNNIMANISKLNQEYAKNASNVERFANIVPETKSVPELVSSLEALANQNGLQLTTISLTAAAADKPTATFSTQSIDVGLAGSYPAFKSFVSSLEKNIRTIDIVSVDAAPSSENSPVIGFRVKANAYYLKP